MPRLALPPETYDDGITVAEAARILGVNVSTVRRMVENKAIEGWRIGAGDTPRSVRISLASCVEYRERNSAGRAGRRRTPERPKPKPTRARASYLEAAAYLRSLGVRV